MTSAAPKQKSLQCTNPRVGEQWIDQYVLGGLEGETRDAFEDHLFDCDYCFHRVVEDADLMPYGDALRQHPELLVQAAARAPRARWFQFAPAWTYSLAAAAMLLLAIGIGYVQQPADWRAAGWITITADGAALVRQDRPDLDEAVMTYKAGHVDAAIQKFLAINRTDPDLFESHYYLGLCYLKQADTGHLWTRKVQADRLAEAIDSLQQAARVAKQDLDRGQAHMALAKAYLLQRQPAKAVAELEAAERLDDNDPETSRLKQQARALRSRLSH